MDRLQPSYDLDCRDPTVAPGVSNIEAGCDGLRMNDATRIIQGLKGRNVIGGDVVCLMPTKDSPNKITSMVAAAIAFEIVSLIADKMQN